WEITSTLLLACCLQAAVAQDHQRSIWEDPIRFATKGTKDDCHMSVTGQGDLTNLRILCRGPVRSYWCEYKGKPHVCRNYNNNPRHYYKQIMWDLRKLQNACQGQSIIKPLMCKRASDEAKMVFTSSSSPDATPKDRPSRPNFARPEQMKPHQSRPDQRPTQTQLQAFRSQPARTSQGRTNQSKAFRKKMTPKPTVPRPTDPVPTSEAKRLAQYYCWRSFQGVCSYFIGWFKN
ncbi:putative fibroblast growth factor-binding protein 2, partial [Triplophysa rosa]